MRKAKCIQQGGKMMGKYKTDVITIEKMDKSIENHPAIMKASKHLKNGEVVAFPTETVYGLGGSALSSEAIDKIFQTKGRPSDNPLIVHLSKKEQLEKYVSEIPEKAKQLIERFWPGPLTIVLKHNGTLSQKVTANLLTVAVRMPDHPIALALIDAANIPLAAPSANTSGKPSPTCAQHVYDDLDGKIPLIVDGGETGVGLESTVVDCTTEEVIILRPGGVTKEELEQVVGKVLIDPGLTKSSVIPRSPGVKYTHYAPEVPLVLIDGSRDFFAKKIDEERAKGKKVGLLVTKENEGQFFVEKEIVIGSKGNLLEIAHNLYDALRSFHQEEVDIIFSEVFPETELGSAIMNRLRKAAGGKIISEK